MLVLSRRRDESIIIGDGLIKVTVIEIRGDKVRLGFECPKELRVNREEVQKRIEDDEAKQLKGGL